MVYNMETITLKLEDDNLLTPPNFREVVVRIPARYERNLYDALGGAYSSEPIKREPDIVFTEEEARSIPCLRESPTIRNALGNMNLQTKVSCVQWLARHRAKKLNTNTPQ